MNIDTLKVFVTVARSESFAAAARIIGADPSFVSRTIAGLEQELSIRLFQRSTRKMQLTEAGELYLSRVDTVIEELAQAREDAVSINSNPTGTLRLTASVAFGQTCLVPLLPKFMQALPNVQLDFVLTDENLDLVSNRIDLAVRLAAEIDSDAICTKLMPTCYRLCATQTYLKKMPIIAKPADISNHDCLLFHLVDFSNHWLFKNEVGQVKEIAIKGNITISNITALREAMLAGVGLTLLPNWLVDGDIKAGRCVDVFPEFAIAPKSFSSGAWLLYPSKKFLPKKVRIAIDLLKQELGKL